MGHYVKTNGGYDVKVPSNGQVNLNTVLGALGTAGFAGINLRNLVGGVVQSGYIQRYGLGGNSIDAYSYAYTDGMQQLSAIV